MEQFTVIKMNPEEIRLMIKESISQAIGNLPKNEAENKVLGDLISIDELGQILGVSKVSLLKWRKQGILPYKKIGKRVYFDKKEVAGKMSILKK